MKYPGHCNDLPDLDVREALVLVDVRGPGVGFRLQGSWFAVEVLGLRVQDLGFRAEGVGSRV